MKAKWLLCLLVVFLCGCATMPVVVDGCCDAHGLSLRLTGGTSEQRTIVSVGLSQRYDRLYIVDRWPYDLRLHISDKLPSHTLGIAWRCFGYAELYAGKIRSDLEMCSVAVHEVGHLLGYAHSELCDRDCMSPFASGDDALCEWCAQDCGVSNAQGVSTN